MKKKFNQGFTLIELLVVIAIIGILASVILASLNSARAKGTDAATKSDLSEARAQAELYYDSAGNTYKGVCSAPSTASPAGINSMMNDAVSKIGGVSLNTTIGTAEDSSHVTCHDVDNSPGVPSAWAAQIPLKSITSPVTYYCVDSSGQAIQDTTVLAVNVVKCQ
jgi:prepilin-type N-terminal cleavage/methylation domain-containing protein